MSVIGRLDEQVDAVLIAPLKKRGEKTPDETTPPLLRSPARNAPSSVKPRRAPANDRMSEPESPKRDELPVWLL
jgi:hypothetical protein